jgi:hypothetical protein
MSQNDEQKRIAATPEEITEALAKDRGCCHLLFYRVCQQLQDMMRVQVVCDECRIEWIVERLGLAIILMPVGVKGRVELVQ